MLKHFENRAAAEAELREYGFQELKNGNWANSICAASIHPTYTGDMVAVSYWEIQKNLVASRP